MEAVSLERFVDSYAKSDPVRTTVAQTILELARAGQRMARIARKSVDDLDDVQTGINTDGDKQTKLDVIADRVFLKAARAAPVAVYASEEQPEAYVIDLTQPLALAIDPLDGSSNVDLNVSFGTIFGI